MMKLASPAQRQLQGDIARSSCPVNNMQTINGRDMTAKRQMASSVHTLQDEVDGMLLGKASIAKMGTKS